MTRCDPSLLSRYLDNELSLSTRNQLERHLVSCPTCFHELEALRSVDEALERWGRQQCQMPPATERRIAQAVEKRRKLLHSFDLGRVMPAAVGSLAAALLVLVSSGHGLLGQAPGQMHSEQPVVQNTIRRLSSQLANERRKTALLGSQPSLSPPPPVLSRKRTFLHGH